MWYQVGQKWEGGGGGNGTIVRCIKKPKRVGFAIPLSTNQGLEKGISLHPDIEILNAKFQLVGFAIPLKNIKNY